MELYLCNGIKKLWVSMCVRFVPYRLPFIFPPVAFAVTLTADLVALGLGAALGLGTDNLIEGILSEGNLGILGDFSVFLTFFTGSGIGSGSGSGSLLLNRPRTNVRGLRRKSVEYSDVNSRSCFSVNIKGSDSILGFEKSRLNLSFSLVAETTLL
jgi:hypothetical protein